MAKAFTDLPTYSGVQATDVLAVVDLTNNVSKQIAAAAIASFFSRYADHRVGIAKKNTTGTLLTTSYATYATVTATTLGREVEIDFRGFISNANSGATRNVQYKVQCDGVDIPPADIVAIAFFNNGGGAPLSFSFLVSHTPAAGSHTWTLQVLASAASSVTIEQVVMKATELGL